MTDGDYKLLLCSEIDNMSTRGTFSYPLPPTLTLASGPMKAATSKKISHGWPDSCQRKCSSLVGYNGHSWVGYLYLLIALSLSSVWRMDSNVCLWVGGLVGLDVEYVVAVAGTDGLSWARLSVNSSTSCIIMSRIGKWWMGYMIKGIFSISVLSQLTNKYQYVLSRTNAKPNVCNMQRQYAKPLLYKKSIKWCNKI